MKFKENCVVTAVKLLMAITCVGSMIHALLIGVVRDRSAAPDLTIALTALVTLLILYVPNYIIYKDILAIPEALQVFFSIFTFCAMFLGEIMDFYTRFSWWDTMLHFMSGILFSMVGYLLFTSLNRNQTIRSYLNPLTTVLFAVCFSVACGVIWEIFEFAGDSLLGMNMQRWQSDVQLDEWATMLNRSNTSNPGLINTMKDIIADTLGSVCSVVVLLPLVQHHNNYVKANVSSQALLDENRQIVRALKSGRPQAAARLEFDQTDNN